MGRNIYLVEFEKEAEAMEVVDRGVWTYKGDVVVLKSVKCPTDLKAKEITHMEVWVQFHHIPPGMITKEGVLLLAQPIGVPLSDAQEVYAGGHHFFKIKIRMEVGKAIKDRLVTKHPVLGKLTVLLVYEKLERICCFCGNVGHEMGGCKYRMRLLRMQADEEYMDRPEMVGITEPRLGAWVSNMALVPKQGMRSGVAQKPGDVSNGGRGTEKDGARPGEDAQTNLNLNLNAAPGGNGTSNKRHAPQEFESELETRGVWNPVSPALVWMWRA